MPESTDPYSRLSECAAADLNNKAFAHTAQKSEVGSEAAELAIMPVRSVA